MLKKNDLFDLTKSLSLSEKRYLFSKANTKIGDENEYALILRELIKMETYSEEAFKEKFETFLFVKKLDVKKHYLFHWILRHLTAFHFKKHPVINQLHEIEILIEKSLYQIAYQFISPLKVSLKASEDFLSLLKLLEKELAVSRFVTSVNSQEVVEELEFYSKAYSDFQTFRSLKYKFRDRFDKYVFVRTEDDLKKLEQIISSPVMDPQNPPVGIHNRFLYNLNYYYYYASSNKWEVSYTYALNNFNLVTELEFSKIDFIDEVIVAYYNLLVASVTLAKDSMYQKVLLKLKKLIRETTSDRFRIETQFSLHLAQLIFVNRKGKHDKIHEIIREAEDFITNNFAKFDKKRRNNFYFDLSKSYFIANDFQKPFHILKNIIENTGEKENSVDFICFSKILYCLTCYERNDIELMIYSARSASYFLREHNSYFDFEKRILRFIRYELPRVQNLSPSLQVSKFIKLKEDFLLLFNNQYENSVLTYFNFVKWAEDKIINPLPAYLHPNS
ncbi:MAG: hypothetical protein HXX09_13305 [Bacteroidetes bacterium]|nr:hypothetical protein [Bacteroidota bacterium]